jgi:hypothetical protein
MVGKAIGTIVKLTSGQVVSAAPMTNGPWFYGAVEDALR